MTNKAPLARKIGSTCWPSGDSEHPCESFSIELRCGERAIGRRGEGYDRLHKKAGASGWVIGHIDGQAYYACPDHAETLYDPISLSI